MTTLEPMMCVCGREIVPRTPPAGIRIPAASSFATCLYQCECGRGYSNSANPKDRTTIVQRPELNIPEEVREGLEPVLAASLNVQNRAAKRQKFCFSTSEDAVTWTIFRCLSMIDALESAADVAGVTATAGEAAQLLLWGVPVVEGVEISKELVSVLDELDETPTRRSEPDVIVAWSDLVVVIEVKYRSQNDRKPGYANFTRYLDELDLFAQAPAKVTELGLYELVRNWRIGAALARRTGRRFALVNLGPRLLPQQTPELNGLFAETDALIFRSASWHELLNAAGQRSELPGWLEAYIGQRELDERWSVSLSPSGAL